MVWVIHRITAVVEVVVIGVVHRIVMRRHRSAWTITHWRWHWRTVTIVVEVVWSWTRVISWAWRNYRHIEDLGARTVPLECQRFKVLESSERVEFVTK